MHLNMAYSIKTSQSFVYTVIKNNLFSNPSIECQRQSAYYVCLAHFGGCWHLRVCVWHSPSQAFTPRGNMFFLCQRSKLSWEILGSAYQKTKHDNCGTFEIWRRLWATFLKWFSINLRITNFVWRLVNFISSSLMVKSWSNYVRCLWAANRGAMDIYEPTMNLRVYITNLTTGSRNPNIVNWTSASLVVSLKQNFFYI